MVRDIKKTENDYFFWVRVKDEKGKIKTKLFYTNKAKNIDKSSWEYNNSDETNCIVSMNKYLLKN